MKDTIKNVPATRVRISEDEIDALLRPERLREISLTKTLSDQQFEWRNDPRITAWTRQNGLISKTDQGRWQMKIAEDRTLEMFGIINEAKENVGTCGLTSISYTHGTAEFSLLIGPEYQRRGYGRLALQELLRYGFNNFRLNCIWGETFEGNPAYDLFTELGMKTEGRARQRYFKNGEYKDSIFISILASEAKEQSWWA